MRLDSKLSSYSPTVDPERIKPIPSFSLVGRRRRMDSYSRFFLVRLCVDHSTFSLLERRNTSALLLNTHVYLEKEKKDECPGAFVNVRKNAALCLRKLEYQTITAMVLGFILFRIFVSTSTETLNKEYFSLTTS